MGNLTCPNCGASVDETAEYCPNCGLRRGPPPSSQPQNFQIPPQAPRPSAGRTAWQIVSLLLFLLIGIPAALFGACLLIIAGGSGHQTWDASSIALVYGPLLLSALLFGLFIMSFVRRKP